MENNLNPLFGVKIKNQKGVENEIDVTMLKDYRLNIYNLYQIRQIDRVILDQKREFL